MASPVVASDFDLVSFSGDVCERIKKMLELHATLREWFTWAFNDDGTVTDAFKAEFASMAVPTGGVLWSPINNVPDGYLRANGQAVSRTIYAGLFSIYGTTFGAGDGSTTFNLPNLQGKFLFGSSDTHPLGEEAGEETHLLLASELPAHTHPISLMIDGIGGMGNDWATWEQSTTSTPTKYTTTGSTGGDVAHNNMPPFRAGIWLVKA